MTSFPKEKLSILLLENISAGAVQQLQAAGYTNIRALTHALTEEELKAAIAGVHLLGIRSKTQVREAVLQAADRLLAIGCFCIGTNQLDKWAATGRGIAVFNAPYSNTRSVAELVIGAAIMLIRRVPDKNKAAHEGIWQKQSANCHELRGRTLAVIGYGNIGAQVSVLAEAMGMRVVFYDIENKLPLGNATACASLEAAVAQADIVTLHVPANKTTKGMINAESLKHFRQGGLFINYARGEAVDSLALRDALQSNHLSGAAVDVHLNEPEQNGPGFSSPLQGLENVLLTPHIGGSTEEAQANIGQDVTGKLISFVETGSTQDSLIMPPLSLPAQEGAHRVLHIHRNVPGVLSAINQTLSASGANILGQYLKTNDQIGYVVLDVDQRLDSHIIKQLEAIKETIRVRSLY